MERFGNRAVLEAGGTGTDLAAHLFMEKKTNLSIAGATVLFLVSAACSSAWAEESCRAMTALRETAKELSPIKFTIAGLSGALWHFAGIRGKLDETTGIVAKSSPIEMADRWAAAKRNGDPILTRAVRKELFETKEGWQVYRELTLAGREEASMVMKAADKAIKPKLRYMIAFGIGGPALDALVYFGSELLSAEESHAATIQETYSNNPDLLLELPDKYACHYIEQFPEVRAAVDNEIQRLANARLKAISDRNSRSVTGCHFIAKSTELQPTAFDTRLPVR